MDQVGEQGDTAGGEEDRELRRGGGGEDPEREADGAEAPSRALDALVDETVGVVEPSVVIVAGASTALALATTVGGMSMWSLVGVGVDEIPVTMDDALEALVLDSGQANREATQR